jgi:TetR/AcrR family tetracycline transcriptional repressor
VLAAARELLSEHGFDALTMRALARLLGVRPNALYSHVESKTALIDELLDETLAGVHTTDSDERDSSAGLHALMISTYEVLLAHPDLVPLYVARQGAHGPNAQRLGQVVLELLGRAGVDGARALEARRVLIIYTVGYAAFATRPPFEMGATVQRPDQSMRNSFQTGLRWLLDGITGGPHRFGVMTHLPDIAESPS